MGSGSSGANGAPSGSSNTPWKKAKPYILGQYKELGGLADKPFEYYPGDTIADTDPASLEAMQARYERASEGSDLTRGSKAYIGDVLGGKYLEANPYLDDVYDRAAGAVTRNYNRAVLPAIDTRYAGAGRTGGGAHQGALGRSAEALAGELGGVATDVYAGNYARERGIMDSAARFAPDLAEADYNDINQLGSVGKEREARRQAEIDDMIARFEFAQEEPWNRSERALSSFQGGGYTQNRTQRGHMDNGRTVWSDLGAFLAGLA